MVRTKMSMVQEPDKVWASVEATINLGNYENIKIQIGESRSLKPKDDSQEIRDELVNELIEDILDKKDEITKE
jgi:hypothetical protein